MAGGKAQAISAGTKPTDKVNTVVVEAMREVGIDICKNKLKAFNWDMIQKADKMITMGCGAEAEVICPASLVETEDWALEDPKGKSIDGVKKIRDHMKARVAELILVL